MVTESSSNWLSKEQFKVWHFLFVYLLFKYKLIICSNLLPPDDYCTVLQTGTMHNAAAMQINAVSVCLISPAELTTMMTWQSYAWPGPGHWPWCNTAQILGLTKLNRCRHTSQRAPTVVWQGWYSQWLSMYHCAACLETKWELITLLAGHTIATTRMWKIAKRVKLASFTLPLKNISVFPILG